MKATENLTVSPDVVRDVARITTLATPGVLGLVDHPPTLSVPPRDSFRAVDVAMRDNRAHVTLHILAADDVSLVDLGKTLQHDVAEAIAEICGIDVYAVDVSIEDVSKP